MQKNNQAVEEHKRRRRPPPNFTMLLEKGLPRKSTTVRCRHRQPRLFLVKGFQRRTARWHIFKPNISIWVNFGGPWNGKGCYVYVRTVDFVTVWYVLMAI
jgi:hypothetical protein